MREATFYEHLEELIARTRICLISIIILSLASLPLTPYILNIMEEELLPEGVSLVALSPFENIVALLELAFALGLILSMPIILYETIKFVIPALYEHERKILRLLVALGVPLFILGVLFSVKIALPAIYYACYLPSPSEVTNFFSLRAFVEYAIYLSVGFGIAFELPLIIGLVGGFGIIPLEFFKENRLIAYIVLTLIGVTILTPEVTTIFDLVTSIVLISLYELGILISRIIGRYNQGGVNANVITGSSNRALTNIHN